MHQRLSLESKFGQAQIKETRIPVHQIVRALAKGDTVDGLLKIYPLLKKKDILACLAYAADLTEGQGKSPEKLPSSITVQPSNGRREIGQYLVIDPNICHGKMTFKGTRIFVEDVLDMVSKGMDWDHIIWECHGSITREAIMEAIRLVGKSFIENKEKRKAARSRVSPRRKHSRRATS